MERERERRRRERVSEKLVLVNETAVLTQDEQTVGRFHFTMVVVYCMLCFVVLGVECCKVVVERVEGMK